MPFVARHAAAFLGVGPVDVVGHVAQDVVDVSGVERVVDGSHYVLSLHQANTTQPLGCELGGSDCERSRVCFRGWAA
jgi:hypothetical protein